MRATSIHSEPAVEGLYDRANHFAQTRRGVQLNIPTGEIL